jgi:hypothetical protein
VPRPGAWAAPVRPIPWRASPASGLCRGRQRSRQGRRRLQRSRVRRGVEPMHIDASIPAALKCWTADGVRRERAGPVVPHAWPRAWRRPYRLRAIVCRHVCNDL